MGNYAISISKIHCDNELLIQFDKAQIFITKISHVLNNYFNGNNASKLLDNLDEMSNTNSRVWVMRVTRKS